MGLMQRRKGKSGEAECARLWREVYPDVARGWQAAKLAPGVKHSDLINCPGWFIEVKRHRKPNATAALRQAIADEGGKGRVPVACTRADNEEWLATLRLEDLLALIKRTT